MINKHPFAVRRSDFDSKMAMHFSTLDNRTDSDDDSDKDSDEEDGGRETAHSSDYLLGIDADNMRKRVSGLGFQRDVIPSLSLEDEVEVEEVISSEYREEIERNGGKELNSEDEEPEEEDSAKQNVMGDLMSPVGSQVHLDEEEG